MEVDTVTAIVERTEDILRRHLILSTSVIEKLYQDDVIGEFTEKQMLGSHSNPSRQMTLLLTTLKTRGLTIFHRFLNVLRATFHGWIADDILETKIELPDVLHKSSNSVFVRDIINKYTHKRDLLNNREQGFQPMKREKVNRYENGQECSDSVQHGISDDTIKKNRARAIPCDRYHSNKNGYNSMQSTFENQAEARSGQDSPVTQIPGSLRDLQRIFDSETVSTGKTMAVLKQEELTIKTLLQQNLREQQDLLGKQEALGEIKQQMKQLSKSAIQVYKREPETRDSRARLRHLQRTYWVSNSR